MEYRLPELTRVFLKLGIAAFGGPAAHIAMMEDEFVARRGWIERQHFLDLIGATNLIPGPNSTEMALHVGYERAGSRGLAVAGGAFLLPAVVLTGALEGISREALTERLEALGAKVTSSVSSRTDLAIVGQGPGSKLDRSRALGIETWDEARLMEALGEA